MSIILYGDINAILRLQCQLSLSIIFRNSRPMFRNKNYPYSRFNSVVMMETWTGGNWSADDLLKYDHINQLELYAVLLALRSFITFLKSKHVKLHIDNVTAVASINHFGSTRSDMCNILTRKIWMLAMESNMWLSPVFIKGTLNKTADFESRQIRHETEWMLSKDIFHKLTEVFLYLKLTCLHQG